MNIISDYQEHIDHAIKFLWEALPSLIMAIIIYILGLWIIRFINRMVRKFFDRADYDPSLESFLQSFISIGLKIMLFVIVITQLGVQSSSLVAIIGAIVPNGQLSNNNIINYNAQNTRRDKIAVGIGYSSNIKLAKEILLEICSENENILKDPAPEVYVAELGDSSVNLSLRFWAENDVFWAAHFHVMEELKNRFDAAGIEIPFPQRVIHQPQA